MICSLNWTPLWPSDGWLFHIILLIMHIDSPGGRCLVYSPALMHLCPLLHWWMYPNFNLRTATSIWLMQDSGINHWGPAPSAASWLLSPSLFLSLPNTFSLCQLLSSVPLSVPASLSVSTKLHLLSLKLWLFSFDFFCSCSPLYHPLFLLHLNSKVIESVYQQSYIQISTAWLLCSKWF